MVSYNLIEVILAEVKILPLEVTSEEVHVVKVLILIP